MSIDNAETTEQPQKLDTGLELALRDVRKHIVRAGLGCMLSIQGFLALGAFVLLWSGHNYEASVMDLVILFGGMILSSYGAKSFIISTYYFITTLIEYRAEYQAKVNLDLLELNQSGYAGYDQPGSPPWS